MAIVDPIPYSLTQNVPQLILRPDQTAAIHIKTANQKVAPVRIIGTDTAEAPTDFTNGMPIHINRTYQIGAKSGYYYWAVSLIENTVLYVSESIGYNRETIQDVDVPGAKTAFGELSTASFSPHCGWSFQYNINPVQIEQKLNSSGSVSQSGSFAEISTGTDIDGMAQINTTRPLVYTPGIGAVVRFTAIFDTPKADSMQIIGVGDDVDGFFFGYNGLNFGVMRRSNSIDNWTYQGDWSENIKRDFIPQLGNVYEIRFQWLGFGMQYFAMENESGDLEDVHRIEYVNKNTLTSVTNPTFPIMARVENNGNDTDIILKTPSAVAGLMGEGYPECFTTINGYSHTQTITGTGALEYLFSIRNPDTFVSKTNHLYLAALLLTLACEGNKPVNFEVRFQTILTNPVWVDVATGFTPAQYDISATATANGIVVLPVSLGKSGNTSLNLKDILDNPQIQAGQWVSIFAKSSSSSDIESGFTFRSRT